MTDDNKTQNNAGIYSSRMIRRLRQHSLEVVVGIMALYGSGLPRRKGFLPAKKSDEVGGEKLSPENTYDITSRLKDEPVAYQLPPNFQIEESQFSEKYQKQLPKSLIKGGIEKIDVEQGNNIMQIYWIMEFNRALHEMSRGSCRLDLQDRVAENRLGFGYWAEKIDLNGLKSIEGTEPLVALVEEANRQYKSVVGRESNFDNLLKQHPRDITTVMNRYLG